MEFNIGFPWRERGTEQPGLWKNLAVLWYVEDCGLRFLPPKYSPAFVHILSANVCPFFMQRTLFEHLLHT